MNAAGVRKRDAERTRQSILEAAQDVFSRHPYAEASLKEITSLAGANAALVSRYFGSKEKLFEAALTASLDPTPLMPASRVEFGERLVAAFIRPVPGRINPLPMLIFATAEARLQAVALKLLRERIVLPLAEWLGGVGAEVQAARIMVIASGFFTYRSLLPLEAMQGDLDENTRAWLVRAFQSAIDAE
ncbi:TetR/AcrR family transcriptional regulator [Henriciella aquimarina]|uniref:TetR/AcrR family transcriptional regulator n=1 Tax=Henriciella aquimarina TaxID=545261 RepID=UPI0009FF89EB|nr:TetR/AcrR family transcriptional regulator [Henriciella aquimarina]